MFETASEIVIWMVLAALVGFATGWALRSVVANRARARLSERLEEKRREAQDLREELRHLRGDDSEDVMHIPGPIPAWEGDDDSYAPAAHGESRGGSARARPACRARPPSTTRSSSGRSTSRLRPRKKGRYRRLHACDAPRRGRVGGRGGAAAQARRRGVERA